MGRIDRYNQENDIFIYLLCYNKNGDLYNSDSILYETMRYKNNESRDILHFQSDMPEIEAFTNELTFKDEINTYLNNHIYKKRRKYSLKVIGNNNKNNEQNDRKSYMWKLDKMKIEDMIKEKIQPYFYDKSLDDIDLSGTQKPRTNNTQFYSPLNNHDLSDIQYLENKMYDDLDLSGIPDKK
jgi:hypothetical protein